MEHIIINDELGAQALTTYLAQLRKAERIALFKARRSEIMKLRDAELLEILYDFGFHQVILPVFATDASIAEIEGMLLDIFSENRVRSLIRVTDEERKEIVYQCAKSAELILFLRSRTMLFADSRYRMCLFKTAVTPVIDSVFAWNIAHQIPLTAREAYFMYAKANPDVIRNYLQKIGCLTGGCKRVTYQMLKVLALRDDMEAEDKHELLLLSVNRLPVHTQTIYGLRKDGLLKF